MNDNDREISDYPSRKMRRAAGILLKARRDATPIPDLPADIRPLDLKEAYELQEHLNALLAETDCGAPVGHKIGCTTDVMQEYMGIPHPCAGRILATTINDRHGSYRRSKLCRPGVECEIAVRIGKSMTGDEPFTAKDCEAYVAAVMASIELVDDRWTDFRKVTTPVLVSDNFFNAGCVIGEGAAFTADEVAGLTGRMWINGEIAGEGGAADILGHPFLALAWLASHRQARGNPLAEGDLVSLGSVVQTQWIGRGDRVRIEFSGLGPCSLKLV